MAENKEQPGAIPDGYILPDGKFLTVDQMEERLKAKVESCRNAKELEEAHWELADYYLSVAKPLQAFPILEEIRILPGDPEKKRACTGWIELIKGGRKSPPSEHAKEDHAAMLIRLAMVSGDNRVTAWGYYKKAVLITENPKTEAVCWLGLGCLCEQRRDYKDAVQCYSQGVDLLNETNEAGYFLNNNMGFSLIQIGQYVEAEWYCRRAIAIDPSRCNAHKNLGLSLREQGKYREAAASFITAVKSRPEDGRALAHLEELVEGRPELYKEISKIENGGLESIKKFVLESTKKTWN